MYIVIKKDKAEKLEEKLYKVKECISAIMDCFEDAKEERYEQDDYRERSRGGRYRARGMEDDYEEDDYRDMARGRSGSGRGRGRY